MPETTIKSLHAFLRLLENPAELKRKLPSTYNPRTVREGLLELSRLVGLDAAKLKEPQSLAAMIGQQRFATVLGEPTVNEVVSKVFDSTRVLVTILLDPTHFERAAASHVSTGLGHAPAAAVARKEGEQVLDSIKPLIAQNVSLTAKVFRAVFEHLLCFAYAPGLLQPGSLLAAELAGKREHGRSFLSCILYILGGELDRPNLLPFMVEQGLFSLQTFELMLQNRDYCEAYYGFRKRERAFIEALDEEEARLHARLDNFTSQFGGKPYKADLFDVQNPDKIKVDAYAAALDLMEALTLTPLSSCIHTAVVASSLNCVKTVDSIAAQFERFARGAAPKDQVNREITDQLLAFAAQFAPQG
ncbi:MAG: hypothetical protein NZ739_00250 [Verrucomicrobiae bacterium]|nr:hypothetical protein [Verrucomicrobiae bacterium]MDW7980071.1 hypothetical protein [Verrucomicrobiales bacterium]